MTVHPQAAMQNSFSAGELSPTLFGRVDLAKYHIGLQTCLNAFPDYRGGVTRRPGTRFVGEVVDTTKTYRLIPFTFSTIQSYVLVFGDLNMRVIRQGGLVTEPTIAVTHSGTTVNATAHGLNTNDWVVVSDFVPPLFVDKIDANSFRLKDLYTGAVVTSVSTTVARIFTLTTPWAAADLPLLKFTQSFDTMTLTHPSYTPRNLTRSQHWVWTLSTINLNAELSVPTFVGSLTTVSGTVPAGTTTDTSYGYRVTAVAPDGDESNPSNIFIFSTYNLQTLAATTRLTWNPVSGADHYNLYSAIPGHNVTVDGSAPTGFIGFTAGLAFNDTDITPDFTKTPPTHQNPLSGNNPSIATYFDQRRVFAASNANPQTLWMSRVAQYNNFDTSTPANDGDALTLTLSSVQSAAIRALVPMPDGLLAFTQSGVYKISGGGQNTGIKVSSALARAQNYIGSSNVPPIPIGFEILFVQEKGSIIRALTYNFYTSTYEPADLTLFSNHLFAPRNITDWTYAEHPYKIVWCLRDDGVMLSLTYLKEEKIQGWARHDIGGVVESIAAIPEDKSDAVYLVVRRTINGVQRRVIERFQSKDISAGIANAWYLDCALDYTGSPVSTLSGLNHLASMPVSYLADGVPGTATVSSGGTLTLATPASRVIAGLNFTTQCQTLDLEPSGQSVQGKRKRVVSVTAKVQETGVLKWGPNFTEMTPWIDVYGDKLTSGIMTGDQPLGVNQFYDYGGRVCWQQDLPLPMNILSLVPELSVGD